MIKKVVALFVILTLILGNLWDYREIADQTVVSGISIDVGQNGKKYRVGFEVLPMPSDPNDAIEPAHYYSDADSLGEAIHLMAGKLGKTAYVGHVWMIALSEEVAEKDIADVVSSIMRYTDFYAATYFAVVDGSDAMDIFYCSNTTSSILSFAITEGFEADEKYNSYTNSLHAYEIEKIITSQYNDSFILPRLYIEDEDEESIVVTSGGSVFREDRLSDWLSAKQVQAYRLATGQVQQTSYIIDIEGEKSAADVIKNSANIHTEFVDGLPVFTIDVKATVSTKLTPDYISVKELKEILESQMKADIDAIIDHSIITGCDYFRFSEIVYRQHYRQWEELKDNWPEILNNLEYYTNISVKIID